MEHRIKATLLITIMGIIACGAIMASDKPKNDFFDIEIFSLCSSNKKNLKTSGQCGIKVYNETKQDLSFCFKDGEELKSMKLKPDYSYSPQFDYELKQNGANVYTTELKSKTVPITSRMKVNGKASHMTVYPILPEDSGQVIIKYKEENGIIKPIYSLFPNKIDLTKKGKHVAFPRKKNKKFSNFFAQKENLKKINNIINKLTNKPKTNKDFDFNLGEFVSELEKILKLVDKGKPKRSTAIKAAEKYTLYIENETKKTITGFFNKNGISNPLKLEEKKICTIKNVNYYEDNKQKSLIMIYNKQKHEFIGVLPWPDSKNKCSISCREDGIYYIRNKGLKKVEPIIIQHLAPHTKV